MDKINLMTYLNHNEIRLCYGCGITYEANDFHKYQYEHCCDIAIKSIFEKPTTKLRYIVFKNDAKQAPL